MSSCAAWAQSGECEKNEAFMKASPAVLQVVQADDRRPNPPSDDELRQPVRLAAIPEPWEASVPLCKSSADVRTYSLPQIKWNFETFLVSRRPLQALHHGRGPADGRPSDKSRTSETEKTRSEK